MEVVSVGHTNSLARVELAWVQYPRFFPRSSKKISDQNIGFWFYDKGNT